jgi:signal transduction histidine kinase
VSSLVWRESLENVFSDDVSGIDCVLRTAKEVFTFHVTDGIASVKGQGDLHDTNYDEYMSAIEIVTRGDFSNTSAVYTLEVYPTEQFFETYITNNAIIGMVGAIAILLVISFLFFMYDSFVRKEFDANAELLEAKRRFVRFVSHEVRTPLNTVCMGLTLLQEDIRGHSGRSLLPAHLTETQRLVAQEQEEANLPASIQVEQKDATEWINLSEEVLSNTQAAVNVLNDLLNYDKIQRGMLSLELSVIPVWELVEKTVKEFNLMAAEKEIKLRLVFAEELLMSKNAPAALNGKAAAAASLDKHILEQVVVGDFTRISMMLRNLLSNALKFTPEKGSLTVQVNVAEQLLDDKDKDGSNSASKNNLRPKKHTDATAEKHFKLANGEQISLPPKGFIDIRVIDTGVGMSSSQLKAVFDDGVQFGANKLQGGGGSGLGMFIARSIVEQHQGTLNVESKGLGFGSTFIAKLPLYYDPSSTSVTSENTEDFPPPSSIGTNGVQQPIPQEFFPQRILVVDDVTPNLKLLMRLLKNRGHSCDGAVDGREAVECVKKAGANNPYDTILLDHEMPGKASVSTSYNVPVQHILTFASHSTNAA